MKIGSFLSNSVIYLASNLFNAIIMFALLPVLTRYLSPSEYGQVAIFQTFVAALGIFVGLNVAGATGRKYYDLYVDETILKNYISVCMQILLGSTLVVVILIFIFKKYLIFLLRIELSWMIYAVVVSASSVVVNIRLTQWQTREKTAPYALLQMTQSALNMTLAIALVIPFHLGATGRIVSQSITAVILLIISLYLLNRDNLLGVLSWDSNSMREALGFGIPLVPHLAGGFLITSIDRFLIGAKLSLADAGIYMVATQLTLSMGLVFDAINKAYVPWLFERLARDEMEEKRKIVKNTYIWFLVIILGNVSIFLLGPRVFIYVAGEKYKAGAGLIGWLALGQGFGGMYMMVTNYLFFSKRTGLLSLVTIVSGAINLLLLLILIPLKGTYGAAVAFSLSMGIEFLLTWWIAQRCHPMPWAFSRLFNTL